MALSNSQYNAILREYERLQAEERSELEKRREEVFRRIPRLKELDRMAGASAMDRFRRAVKSGTDDSVRGFSEEVRRIEEEKARLIKEAGYPPDILLPRYRCEKCRDTGFVDGRKCTCFQTRAIKMLYARSNLERIMESENFRSFSLDWYDNERVINAIGMTERAYMERVLEICRSYVKKFRNAPGNILFQGNTGVGKTFLSNCIAKDLIEEGFSVIYLTAGEMFDCLAEVRIDKTEDLAKRELFDYIFSCDLLLVDDLGTEVVNTFTSSQFFYLVNRRLNEERGTVISTNLSMRMMRDLYTERVTSRITSGYDIVMLYGDDIRRKKRIKELAEANRQKEQ